MYFWKIDLLKQQLSTQGLTEKQLYYYILIYVALSAIGVETLEYMPRTPPNSWSYVQSIISVAIPILGTIMAFRANRGESGVQFAARYFSIGLVATIRFMVLLIPIVIAMMVYWSSSYDPESEIPTSGLEVVIFSAWYALVYAYIAKHIRQVAVA
jgi:membrane protein YdbS with pleckstrin-like domain